METFENKSVEFAGELVINKGLIHTAGFGNRAIPTYVGEWIIDNFKGESDKLEEESRLKISSFISKYLPQKGEKENLKNELLHGNEIKLLDRYAVLVNLDKGERFLSIPFLDIHDAYVNPKIVDDNPMLLSSGLWGVGTLFYIPPDNNSKGRVWLKEFKPFQVAKIDIDFYKEIRKNFTIEEWINLIVSSMGFNINILSHRQKVFLICRIIPLIEPRYNLIELAPKGTGKSFVYDNISRYVAVRAGNITPSVLFFNDVKKIPGLITRYDCVVLDEVQKIKGDDSGELTALLKVYLESGKFSRGTSGAINTDASLVLLANIEMADTLRPLHDEVGLFKCFPNFLSETAFIDRFSGLLPGWELPRITKKSPSNQYGFKGDIFSEIIHSVRSDTSFKDYIKLNINLENCEDMRDTKAIEAGAAGLMKILFPDKNLTDEEFVKYCVNPALEMRQRVRDELTKLDREYLPTHIKSSIPDDFQLRHILPRYYVEEKEK